MKWIINSGHVTFTPASKVFNFLAITPRRSGDPSFRASHWKRWPHDHRRRAMSGGDLQMPSASRAAYRHLPLAAIICLGFALRCYWWLAYPVINSPDALLYLKEADNLSSTGAIASAVCMPLYPALIMLAGPNGIIVLQLALSTATIYLGYRISRDVWPSRTAGLVAAFMLAVHPMLIYYATFRLTETIFIFLVLLGFAAIYRNQIAGAAIAFVLANLMRPTLDLFLPIIVIAGTFATTAKPSIREIARRLGVFALIYCVLMAPWWVHNYKKYHQFVRLNLATGISMILENNEQFEQYGLDWSKLTPWAPFGQIADPIAQSAAMRSAAMGYIRANPSAWLRGDFDRLKRFLTPSDLNYNKLQARVSAILLILAIAGALASLADTSAWRRRLPLWLPIVLLSVATVSFHALPRYRLPLDPLLIVLASGSLAGAGQMLRRMIGRRAEPLQAS
jgi:4-amino-4-deoxy-L-arabinose transferase-like glycosyltransferase